MRSILRLFLVLTFVVTALAQATFEASACGPDRKRLEQKNDTLVEVVNDKKPWTEVDAVACPSPPLIAKTRSDVPITLAIGLAGTAIMELLRRRKASMLTMGVSLVGVCAAIGYFWHGF